MTYFLIISCVVCGWAMLSLLGMERTQLVQDMEAQLKRQKESQPPAQPAAPPPPAQPPAKAKPKH
jgi:hypothetical protein